MYIIFSLIEKQLELERIMRKKSAVELEKMIGKSTNSPLTIITIMMLAQS